MLRGSSVWFRPLLPTPQPAGCTGPSISANAHEANGRRRDNREDTYPLAIVWRAKQGCVEASLAVEAELNDAALQVGLGFLRLWNCLSHNERKGVMYLQVSLNQRVAEPGKESVASVYVRELDKEGRMLHDLQNAELVRSDWKTCLAIAKIPS